VDYIWFRVLDMNYTLLTAHDYFRNFVLLDQMDMKLVTLFFLRVFRRGNCTYFSSALDTWMVAWLIYIMNWIPYVVNLFSQSYLHCPTSECYQLYNYQYLLVFISTIIQCSDRVIAQRLWFICSVIFWLF
jgi:hypothetical protein